MSFKFPNIESLALPQELPTAATAFAVTALASSTFIRLKQHIEGLSTKNNDPDVRKKRSLLHEKFAMSKVPEDLDYIVIGSGMGGLSCAAILARLGKKVLVLEQHRDVAGGGTHMFDLKGYTFDSGLHYTVPWSQPLFALTCLKKPKDCIPFDLMTESDDTIEKVYLVNPDDAASSENITEPFRVRYNEPHLADLYRMFPEEKEGLDKYIQASNDSMDFVKFFLLSKLFPKWLQSWYWACIPARYLAPVSTTAKELLPRYIKNKKLISLLSSMWIDTGARPDRASFMMTASVFRGIPMEGGCYPRGGSTEMAKELVTVIEVRLLHPCCCYACFVDVFHLIIPTRILRLVLLLMMIEQWWQGLDSCRCGGVVVRPSDGTRLWCSLARWQRD